jgi:hypothetical protein
MNNFKRKRKGRPAGPVRRAPSPIPREPDLKQRWSYIYVDEDGVMHDDSPKRERETRET